MTCNSRWVHSIWESLLLLFYWWTRELNYCGVNYLASYTQHHSVPILPVQNIREYSHVL